MLKTSLSDLAKTLKRFELPKSPVVIVHSGMLRLGLVERGTAGLLDVVREWVGPDGTLVMPAFTFSYPSKKIWKSSETVSEVGALAEYFRNRPGVVRTVHPIHSVCAEGKYAAEIAKTFCLSSFGKNSSFDWLFESDAWNFSIGTDFEGGATYLHLTEEALQVPYRYYKKFPGEIYDASGQRVPEDFTMYARVVTDRYQYVNVWDGLWSALNEAKVFKTVYYHSAPFYFSRIKEGHQVFQKLLLKDPFYSAVVQSSA